MHIVEIADYEGKHKEVVGPFENYVTSHQWLEKNGFKQVMGKWQRTGPVFIGVALGQGGSSFRSPAIDELWAKVLDLTRPEDINVTMTE